MGVYDAIDTVKTVNSIAYSAVVQLFANSENCFEAFTTNVSKDGMYKSLVKHAKLEDLLSNKELKILEERLQ